MEEWRNYRVSIKSHEIVDYMMSYGKNRETFNTLYTKLNQDINKYSKIRRAGIRSRTLTEFNKNIKYLNNNIYNLLDYLCILARLEKGNKTSVTKYQFYHLFNKILK